jgi:hypothetical protein
MSFLFDRFSANAIAANIIPKKAIIGKVAVRGRSKSELPQAYKKIAITSKMTNIKTYA